MESGKRDGGKRGRNSNHGAGIMSKRRQLAVGKGCKGVFLTCNRQPLDACNEFLTILDRYLEEYGSSATADKPQEGGQSCIADDVAAGISAELQGISERSKRFQVHNQLLPGVAFIRFTWEEDVPSELCHGLLKSAVDNPGRFSCRHASRLLPVDVCANPSLEDLAAASKQLCCSSLPFSNAALGLCPDFPVPAKPQKDEEAENSQVESAAAANANPANSAPAADGDRAETAAADPPAVDTTAADTAQGDKPKAEEATGRQDAAAGDAGDDKPPELSKGEEEAKKETKGTWACAFSSRGFGTVKKEQVLEVLARQIGKNYKVDITNAQQTFLVEVNPYFFGLSLVRDYGRLFRYNLHRCCHPEAEEAEKKKETNRKTSK